MLKINQLSIYGAQKQYLDARQNEIDNINDFSEKVNKAESSWEKKNANIFKELRALLAEICPGTQRCGYCEDSVADEVEHVWPKKFFPSKTFKWENYLFACGPCNGSSKGDQFALFYSTSQYIELVRRRGEAATPPPNGTPVFIDPRTEDPLDFIELDLDTCMYVPCAPFGSQSHMRAEYTIKILKLNKRDYLVKARKNAYASYLDSAHQYVSRKISGAPENEIKQRLKDISERHHPSVWNQIKKLSIYPPYKKIFDAAPELLSC